MGFDYKFKMGDEVRFRRNRSDEWTYGRITKVGVGESHAYGERLVHPEYRVESSDGRTHTIDTWDETELVNILDRIARDIE